MIRPLGRAHIFPKAVFLVVAMEWLLGDKDILSPVLEIVLEIGLREL